MTFINLIFHEASKFSLYIILQGFLWKTSDRHQYGNFLLDLRFRKIRAAGSEENRCKKKGKGPWFGRNGTNLMSIKGMFGRGVPFWSAGNFQDYLIRFYFCFRLPLKYTQIMAWCYISTWRTSKRYSPSLQGKNCIGLNTFCSRVFLVSWHYPKDINITLETDCEYVQWKEIIITIIIIQRYFKFLCEFYIKPK